MRIPILAAAALLLSACWTGDSFYVPSDARPAVPAGQYRSLSADGEAIARVTILPNGLTRLEARGESRPTTLGFVPLAGDGRRHLIWQSGQRDGRTMDDDGLYGLLERTDAGEYYFYLPQCEDTEPIARAAGAAIDQTSGVMICTFPNRASLEAAMRQWHPDPAEAIGRLVPTDSQHRG